MKNKFIEKIISSIKIFPLYIQSHFGINHPFLSLKNSLFKETINS